MYKTNKTYHFSGTVSKTAVLLFLLFFHLISFAQTKTITGKVTDGQTSNGLSQVTITAPTGQTAISGGDGSFSISVPASVKTLTFSYTGRTPKTVAILGNSLEVSLDLQVSSLDNVVVVGYGTQKKGDLTGSISTISSKDLEKAVFNTVDQLVQGRSAGVLATSTSGEPGADVAIRIRGNNSISGNNSPLYVVDGIPINGTPNFNPQDVESLEILKDASATAIYGSRGANGVIIVSTKRGSSGRAVLELNSNTSFTKVIKTYEMLSGADYANYRNEANVALGIPAPFTNPSQYAGQGFNWQDEILKNGVRTDYGLSVSGGKNDVRYFVSGNYLDDKGIILDSRYTRSNLRANVDADALNNKLKLQFSFNTTQEKNNRAISASRGFPDQAGPIVNALMSEPIVPSKTYSGQTGENEQFYNPYLEVTDKKDRNFFTTILTNAKATYKISKALSNTFYAGLDYGLNNREIFYPSTVGQGINSMGVATTSNGRSYNYVLSDYLNYQNKFADKHDVGVTAGLEYSEFNSYSLNNNISNFEVQSLGLDNIGIGTSLNNIGSGRSKSTLASGFLRLNYTYNNKYLLTFTGRADGSSRFAENEKWGFFPSAAVGWRISEERFLKDNSTISNLKLRASFGETGSQSIAPYQSLARYGTTIYPIGNTPTLGYIPQSVANPNLRWETTRQLDIGLDLGLLDNKIEFTFDYFKKTTVDLLQSISIPAQSGFTGALVNFGSIENKGVEFSITAHPVNTKSFAWNTSFNLTAYKNIVLELGGDKQIFGPTIGTNLTGSGHIYQPGEEFGRFWGLVATGLIQQSDLDAATASGKPLPALNNDRTLGHWLFKDLNGDGVINNNDREAIGNPNPDFLFGFNNDFSYKSFSLNVFIQGTVGNDVYNTVGTIINEGFNNNESYKNQTVEWYQKRWTPSNPHNDIRFPSINGNSPSAANYMVEDASYVRLKSVSLRYLLPINNSALTSLQFYVTGTNLITLTKYTGFDPEVSMLGANTLAPGVDLGAYPRQSGITLGLNAKF